jgi:excisionase family DNA binding protein
MLLSTAAVARLLNCSRQHVVNLCERGDLPFVRVGDSHRRIRRSDVDELLRLPLRREQEQSLWLHRAVMAHVVADPEGTMAKAQANVAELLGRHANTMAAVWIEEWVRVLDRGVDAVLDVLGSRTERAVELRQNSPFAGVLPEHDRQAVLAAFRRHWRTHHAPSSVAA